MYTVAHFNKGLAIMWRYTLFFMKKWAPKVFLCYCVYRYIMVKSLKVWCNGIHLLTNTLHWLRGYHSKNCEVHLISSWKQEVYCKNTAKKFLLIVNSNLFVLIVTCSVLVPAILVLLNFFKKVTKELFSILNDDPYSVSPVIFFLAWT